MIQDGRQIEHVFLVVQNYYLHHSLAHDHVVKSIIMVFMLISFLGIATGNTPGYGPVLSFWFTCNLKLFSGSPSSEFR